MNVSKRSVERARKVTKRGVPELTRAVTQGEVKVSTAAKLAKRIAMDASPAAAAREVTNLIKEGRLTKKAGAKAEPRAERLAYNQTYNASVKLGKAMSHLLLFKADDKAWSWALKHIEAAELRKIITMLQAVYDKHCQGNSVQSAADRADPDNPSFGGNARCKTAHKTQ
jgi:hypothetical protein